MDNNKPVNQTIQEKTITRKEAIQKVGKYTAFTAATMMMLMSPSTAEATQKSGHKPKPRG